MHPVMHVIGMFQQGIIRNQLAVLRSRGFREKLKFQTNNQTEPQSV